MRSKTARTIQALEARGFDRCYISRDRPYVHVGCSQCAALAISGVACHETGCPNQTHGCEECDAPISKRLQLCDSCANPEQYDESFLHEEE